MKGLCLIRIFWAILVTLALGTSQSAFALTQPPWLYSVELPVEEQSAEARQRVARSALLVVLTRLTGLTSIPRNAVIKAALAKPAQYYDEFRFVDGSGAQRGQSGLRLNFQGEAILSLIKDARLPIWWTRRPQVVAWIVVEQLGERTLLSANSDHPLKEALKEVGRARGIELQFPLMDLDDLMQVNADDLWGNVTHGLLEVSERYGGELNLVGRVSSDLTYEGLHLAGGWTFWLNDEVYQLPFAVNGYDQAVQVGINGLVAELIETYSVPARASQRWEVRVSGLRGMQPFAELMRYVKTLDWVDGVEVTSVQGDVATLVLSTGASADQLLNLLTIEEQLVEDTLHLGRGVQLMWRG
ncbi:MAG: hypothetical protein ACI9ON_000956 [Limisphaerales bacterium]|jgi:hypothetical protein